MTNVTNAANAAIAAITLNTDEVAPALETLEPYVSGTEKTIQVLEDRAGRLADALKEHPASENLIKDLGITLSVLNLALDAQGKALENEKNYWEWVSDVGDYDYDEEDE